MAPAMLLYGLSRRSWVRINEELNLMIEGSLV